MIKALAVLILTTVITAAAAVWAAPDATNSYTANRDLTLVAVSVNIDARELLFVVRFTNATGRRTSERFYRVNGVDGTVRDDQGDLLPNVQVGVRRSLLGGGANLGLLPELRAYIAANASAFVE